MHLVWQHAAHGVQEDLTRRTEVIRSTDGVGVHALAQIVQILHCEQMVHRTVNLTISWVSTLIMKSVVDISNKIPNRRILKS